jgi:hypothetical protein
MKFDYPHALGRDDARARLARLGEYLQNRHGIRVTWAGDVGRFQGKYLVVHIEGELALAEGVVHVTGSDPGFLWRKRAAEYIRGKLESYLDPKAALDDLPTGKSDAS